MTETSIVGGFTDVRPTRYQSRPDSAVGAPRPLTDRRCRMRLVARGPRFQLCVRPRQVQRNPLVTIGLGLVLDKVLREPWFDRHHVKGIEAAWWLLDAPGLGVGVQPPIELGSVHTVRRVTVGSGRVDAVAAGGPGSPPRPTAVVATATETIAPRTFVVCPRIINLPHVIVCPDRCASSPGGPYGNRLGTRTFLAAAPLGDIRRAMLTPRGRPRPVRSWATATGATRGGRRRA